jgi:uncharacterized protein (TIGR02996 family)
MSERDALMQAVLAAPDDDAPRLVFADWLDEHGEPERAEFVRVQCELARTTDPGRRGRLLPREKELLDQHSRKWAGPLAKLATAVHFRRGFVEGVTVGARNLLDSAEKLFSLAPVRYLKVLRLNQTAGAAEAIAQLPQLGGVEELDLGGNRSGGAKVAALLRSPHLGRVRRLDLTESGLDGVAYRRLAEAAVPSLNDLTLNANTFTGQGRTLAAAEPTWKLERLALQNASVAAADVVALASWTALASLRHLDLAWNRLPVAVCEAIAGSKHLAKLESIDLTYTTMGAAGILALVEALPNLRHLQLRGCNVGQRGLKSLVSCRLVGQLDGLRLRGNGLGAGAGEVLAAAPELGRWRVLDLGNNEIGDEGMGRIARSPHAAGIVELDASQCNLAGEAVDALVGGPIATTLEVLRLDGNHLLGSRDAERLMALPRLRALSLEKTDVSRKTLDEVRSRFPIDDPIR